MEFKNNEEKVKHYETVANDVVEAFKEAIKSIDEKLENIEMVMKQDI